MELGMRLRTHLLAVLAGALLAVLAPGALAGTPAQDLAWLNAKRTAHGIPGGITLDTTWSARCAQHLRYMRATETVVHAEDPASPHYTEDGNWAGTHAVLASTQPWTETDFIWETAPLHLSQLLAPQLSTMGIADDGQLVCATTWPGFQRAAPTTPTVVTYPGNGTSIYASETSEEWPITPATALGLANPTGPHLYVYAWGGASSDVAPLGIRTATLTGPSGPVALRWADQTTPTIGQYLPTAAGIVIPSRPLEERASYIASVTLTSGARHVWGFTTQPDPSAYAARRVRITTRSVGTAGLRVRIRGRIADRATGAGLAAVPLAISIGGRTAMTVLTLADGRFERVQRIPRGRSGGSVVVTLRAADSLTAAYVRQLSP